MISLQIIQFVLLSATLLLLIKPVRERFFNKIEKKPDREQKSDNEQHYKYLLSASIKTLQCYDFLRILSEISNLDKTIISEYFWKLSLCTTMQDMCRGQVIAGGIITVTPLECDEYISNISLEISELLEQKRKDSELREVSTKTVIDLISILSDSSSLLLSLKTHELLKNESFLEISNQANLYLDQINFSIETLKTSELTRPVEIDCRRLVDSVQKFSIKASQTLSSLTNNVKLGE